MSKTIFFITNALSGGGAERVMSNLANYLTNKGYTIKFILLNGDTVVYPLDSSVEIIVRTDKNGRDTLAQIKFIRQYMKQNKDALFVSFFTHQNIYTILASIGIRARVLVSERNDPNNSFAPNLKKIMDPLRKILYKNHHCKKVIFQTSGAADYFSKKIKNKGLVIPNPLKKEHIPAYYGDRKNTVVAVGRLNSQKNYPLLLKAFNKFSQHHPQYKLEIYGDGVLRPKMEDFINRNDLADKVELCGFCQNVHERIIDAGMYVMSSDFEGLSNALIEAMALGLPVISTDHPPGGAREYITDYDNGILTPVGDIDALADAMCYVAEHPDKAKEMAKNAAAVRDKLSFDDICKKWQAVFDSILQ